MKRFAFTLAMLIAASVATGAQAMSPKKVDSTKHTTAELQSIIKQQGSVILSTGPGVFDRYVANSGQCGQGQFARAAYAPTADASSAFVGYRCITGSDM
jgi:hypothetical protein